MRRRSVPSKLSALGDFRVCKQFAATDPGAWRLIHEWQHDRLIKGDSPHSQLRTYSIIEIGKYNRE